MSQVAVMANFGDINLGALQRRDNAIEKILCSSGHCILYVFDTKITNWVKTEIEGNLYIFRRNSGAAFGFTLLNTKHQKNFTQDVTADMGLQLNFPYLLYKNIHGIYAVWFHDKEDSKKIFDTLQRCLKTPVVSPTLRTSPKWTEPPKSMSKTDCQNKNDSILSMLSAADAKSGNSCSVNPPKSGKKNRSHKSSISPNSGLNSGRHQSAFTPVVLNRSKSHEDSKHPKSFSVSNVVDIPSKMGNEDQNNMHPLLAQMFGKTPTDSNSSSGAITEISTGKIDCSNVENLSPRSSCSLPQTVNASKVVHKAAAVDPSFVSEESFQALQLMAPSHFMSDEDDDKNSDVFSTTWSSPSSTVNEAAHLKSVNDHVVSKTSPSCAKLLNGSRNLSTDPVKPVLSANQMQQALLYLIQNDETFIYTLHDAYLKSVSADNGNRNAFE